MPGKHRDPTESRAPRVPRQDRVEYRSALTMDAYTRAYPLPVDATKYAADPSYALHGGDVVVPRHSR